MAVKRDRWIRRWGIDWLGSISRRRVETTKTKATRKKRINSTKRSSTQAPRMVKSDEFYKKLLADMEVSGRKNEEKLLWEKRASLETKIEKREKMLQNANERLNCRWVLDDFEQVGDEVSEMEAEVRDIREEMSLLDREIRAKEREGLEEEERVSKATKIAEEEAKMYTLALEEAKQKEGEMAGTIRKIEAKLREMGKM